MIGLWQKLAGDVHHREALLGRKRQGAGLGQAQAFPVIAQARFYRHGPFGLAALGIGQVVAFILRGEPLPMLLYGHVRIGLVVYRRNVDGGRDA